MTKAELLAAIAHFPDDAVITTNGEDGEWCDDVNVESVDAPHRKRASDDKSVIFIRGYGPGNLNRVIPTVKEAANPYIGWPQEGYHNDKLEPFDTAKYEYDTTENQRKCNSIPPPGDGWEELDWRRWDYTEDVFWRRLRQPASP